MSNEYNANEEVAKRRSFKWLVQNTPGVRLVFGWAPFFIIWCFAAVIVTYIVGLVSHAGLMPMWLNYYIDAMGFIFVPDFAPLLGVFVIGWSMLLPIFEIFVVLPMHRARRKQAKKEGEHTYKAVGLINCRYLV
jgi:hypothetical protein